ncbi:hypothetical protein [Fluviicola sp.]|uniref:hypothetical protein n=1 Tax=Fluviicola sp. TaxID=1917219 RepID=UPI0026104F2B|nr:hypothetical protein [Fluviicola sp.]
MKRTTSNKLSMYGSVLSVLNDQQTSWQSIPAFASAKTAFETKLNQLRLRVTEQLGATTGVTLEKRLRITDLRERMLVVQHALFLLGRASGDVLLKERNHQTKTDLDRLALNELAARCAELKQDIDTYGTQLAQYGITTQTIDELIPLLETVSEVNNSTRKAIIKRKGITQSIRELEHELDELLREELDRLILVFKQTAPKFYHAYESARITIDYGSKGSRGDEPLNPAV